MLIRISQNKKKRGKRTSCGKKQRKRSFKELQGAVVDTRVYSGFIGSLRLEKPSKMAKSNHQPIHSMLTYRIIEVGKDL